MSKGVVIVGASHAGVQAAASLRQSGWQEPIVLLSAEGDLPYHRPPLSKAFLLGEKTADQLQLRAEAFYADQGIDLLLGHRVRALDLAARRVETSRGAVGFGALVLATGSRARPLPVPGGELEGVLSLRDLADARRLKAAIEAATSVAVVGGGYIGLEVASTAVKHGRPVTVVEAQPRLLARSVPAPIARYLADYHRARGVRLLLGAGVEAIEGEAGAARAVRLAGGERIAADLVIVGVGGVANTELAAAAELEMAAGGILVDAHAQTSLPGIYAAGDCAAFDNRFSGGTIRLESVQNAVDQAKAAAAHIAGKPSALDAVPWFWTDQYDIKLQMAGVASAAGDQFLRGSPESNAWSLLHVEEGRLVACFSINRAADHMAARKLIATGSALDLAAAVDPDVPLLRAIAEPGLPAAAQ